MKKIIFYLLLMGPLLAMFFSCEKDNTFPSNSSEIEFSAYNQDELLQSLAQIVAKAQQSSAFRNIILEEAKTNYGGEQTAFYSEIKDKPLNDGQTVQELLAREAKALGISPTVSDFDFLSKRGLTKLSFTLYDGTSDNDLSSFTYSQPIPVIAEDAAFISSEKQMFDALDENLNPVKVSNIDDPNFAVLVLENNMSFSVYSTAKGRSLEGKILSEIVGMPIDQALEQEILGNIDLDKKVMINSEYYNLISTGQIIDYINNLIEPIRDNGADNRWCPRDDRNGDEAVKGVRIVHNELKDFCRWYKKNCKVEVTTIFAGGPNFTAGEAFLNNLPKKFIHGKRKDMKDAQNFYYFLPLYKLEYLEGNHGEKYLVNFVGKHHNPDGSSKFSISLTPKVKFKLLGATVELTLLNTSYEITKAFNDSNLGGDDINYCESIETYDCSFSYCGDYSSGSITFWISKLFN